MPIQSQGIITRDNVSVDVSAVAYFRVVDAVEVGRRDRERVRPRSTRSPRPRCARSSASTPWTRPCPRPTGSTWTSAQILDVTTVEWGVEVTLVELKDIQLPESMKRAMARQAEAEREKRAKIINAEGESPRRRSARRRLRHHDGPPARPAAAQPAEPGRDRRRQEHHRRVPRAADDAPSPNSAPSSPAKPPPPAISRRARSTWSQHLPKSIR